MNIKFASIVTIFCVISSCAYTQEPRNTVFLTILARNKAHMLPYFLPCIDNLSYDKQLITIYINTNNNIDATEDMLHAWAEKHKNDYKQIIFESHEVEALSADTISHDWTINRLKVLGAIRN